MIIMVDYRREMKEYEYRNLLAKYKEHCNAEGGIFKPDKRRKLLGVKSEIKRPLGKVETNFWSDVRKTVKSGFMDLELICEEAHPEQLEIIFRDSLTKEQQEQLEKISDPAKQEDFLQTIPSFRKMLKALFKDYVRIKRVKDPSGVTYSKKESIEKSDAWRASLARDVVLIGLNFFKEHGLVTTKAHQRLVEELEDMLSVELGHAYFLERELRNVIG